MSTFASAQPRCYLCSSTRETAVRFYHGARVCSACWLEHELPFLCANHGGARPDGQSITVIRRSDGSAACPRCREEEQKREVVAALDRDVKTPTWPRRWPYPT